MCPWAISIIVLVIRCPTQCFELLCAKRAISANQRTRYVSRFSELFLSTNILILVLETEPRREDLN
jgi:glycyl-tRNA synthetase alpha subunit